jgi:hypothetical protein
VNCDICPQLQARRKNFVEEKRGEEARRGGCWAFIERKMIKAVFSSFKISKILQDSPSHQIFGRMHEALNVGKKITNCTVCL